jgi:NAD-dependent SIR2 family protein deacetylase
MTGVVIAEGVVADAEAGVIGIDGEVRYAVDCDHCEERYPAEDAAGSTFNGDVAQYRCSTCGEWSTGPPPGD